MGEMINAEIVSSKIGNLLDTLRWLDQSFFMIRLKNNPHEYTQ